MSDSKTLKFYENSSYNDLTKEAPEVLRSLVCKSSHIHTRNVGHEILEKSLFQIFNLKYVGALIN